MPRSRAAADFYNMASSCFDIVSNIIPSPIKVNSNNKSDCVCVAEPTDINLYELKDFMDGQIEEIKGILVLSTAPVSLVETLYTDVIKSYNEEGPYSLPPIDKVTELYNSFNEIIEGTDGCVDTRLLIFRDLLQMTSVVKDTHMKKIVAEQRICELLKQNNDLHAQVSLLLEQINICNGDGDHYAGIEGRLIFEIIKPKPLIYVQALFNITLAWYFYLHGDVMKPKEYQATIEYVESLGTKQDAYDILIPLLDEKYKDQNEEFEKLLNGTGDCSDSSSANTPDNNSSGPQTSSNSNGNTSSSAGSNLAVSCDYEASESDSDSDFDSESDSDSECGCD